MTERYLIVLLQLRQIVGFLGETNQFGWWSTAFFDGSSSAFLQPVFPRSMALARYHGVIAAARRMHDEYLSIGTYHLFRLPEEIEQDLHSLMQHRRGDDRADQQYQDTDDALGELKGLAGRVPVNGDKSGPVMIGSVTQLPESNLLAEMAGVYHASFAQGTNAFPYLMEKS